MKHRLVGAVCAAMLALAGCSDSTGPGNDSRFVLESINGQALPVTMLYGGTVQRIESDTLVFNAKGRGLRVEHATITSGAGPAKGFRTVQKFTWRVRDGETEVTYECPDLASCLAGPHLSGTLSGDLLSMQVAPDDLTRQRRRHPAVASPGSTEHCPACR